MTSTFRVAPANVVSSTSARIPFASHNADGSQYHPDPTAPNEYLSRCKRPRSNRNIDNDQENIRPTKRPYTTRTTVAGKLDEIFNKLERFNWSLGDLLWYLFHNPTEKEPERPQRHYTRVQKFLNGQSKHTVGEIIHEWFTSPDAPVGHDPTLKKSMYSTTVPYKDLEHAQSALTSFAAQIIEQKLVNEAVNAVKPQNGLHASLRRNAHNQIEWVDFGSSTVNRVSDAIQRHQPLTWEYCVSIIQSRTRRNPESSQRPVHMVCTHAIAALDFARNREARLLPLARGLHQFSLSTPADVMSYSSRIGEIPAYQTIRNVLGHLSDNEAAHIRALGRNQTKLGFLDTDNVQNYHRLQDIRIGRTNQMNIGMAATWVELDGADVAALDLEDKRSRIAQNLRETLTVRQLRNALDLPHLDMVGGLHWLSALVNHIPELFKWKEHITDLFRDHAAKIRLSDTPTRVHPLATSGKNETVNTELKDALLDFFAQLGSTESDYDDRLMLISGDGLTYEKLIQLKQYLQLHPSPFQRFEFVQPILATWHTEWTNLSRIYQCHWDSLQSQDPSTLGHSAGRVNHPAPSNLKKVDYYPSVEFLYLVLDVRMLDCWRIQFGCEDIFLHFEQLAKADTLPAIEDLEKLAGRLHRAYSTPRAAYHALGDVSNGSTEWYKTVPLGSLWKKSQPTEAKTVDATTQTDGKKGKQKGKQADEIKMHESGDLVLASNMLLLSDAILAKELSYATADGDVGRVYEVLKTLIFSFAGSSHTKYARYMLEFFCSLELESSPALRETILRTLLVNLTGRSGAFSAADIMQEYFNRILEAIVQRKGVEYGHGFIRDVISRNLHHFARIKIDLRAGINLGQRSGAHTAPHVKPEVRTLLDTYKKHELHHRRPGRRIQLLDRDDFGRGIKKLSGEMLDKWVKWTTLARTAGGSHPLPSASDFELDESEAPSTLDLGTDRQAAGHMELHNGELLVVSEADILSVVMDELESTNLEEDIIMQDVSLPQ